MPPSTSGSAAGWPERRGHTTSWPGSSQTRFAVLTNWTPARASRPSSFEMTNRRSTRGISGRPLGARRARIARPRSITSPSNREHEPDLPRAVARLSCGAGAPCRVGSLRGSRVPGRPGPFPDGPKAPTFTANLLCARRPSRPASRGLRPRATSRRPSAPRWGGGVALNRGSNVNDEYREFKARLRRLDEVLANRGVEAVDLAQALSRLRRAERHGDRSREPDGALRKLLERAEAVANDESSRGGEAPTADGDRA